MAQYDKQILHALLDSYENSVQFTGENKVNRGIAFAFNKKTIPAYFDESSLEYEKIHVVVEELEKRRFVKVVRKQGGIISKVVMQVDALQEIYCYLNRIPKQHQLENSIAMLKEYKASDTSPICTAFLEYLLERLENHQSVKEYLDISDLQTFRVVVEGICAIEVNTTPCYVREFSIRTFQDSKLFEQIKGKIVRIFREFGNGFKEREETDILAEYNIYHTPNYVHIKGNVTLMIRNERFPLYELQQGLGISGEDIDVFSLEDYSNVRSVITIENLTTYFRYYERNSLVIYLGGYHNSVRRILLKNIYQILPDAQYYHFGDIDAGGFDIYRDLKEKTGIPFEMYNMNLQTLKEYQQYGKQLTKNDCIRLEKIREEIDDAELKEEIQYMLEHNVKLEQECILV